MRYPLKKGKKSARKSAPGVPFSEGTDTRRGRGPRKGEGGRPPDEFKQRMRELATSHANEAYLRKCLAGEFGPRFYLDALKHVTEHGYGRPVQALEHSMDGPIEVTVTRRIVRPDAVD